MEQISPEFSYFNSSHITNSSTNNAIYLSRVALTANGDSKFGTIVKRLRVFVMSGFVACALSYLGCDRWSVFKSEGKTQRFFVILMQEIENH